MKQNYEKIVKRTIKLNGGYTPMWAKVMGIENALKKLIAKKEVIVTARGPYFIAARVAR